MYLEPMYLEPMYLEPILLLLLLKVEKHPTPRPPVH
jgi:hypothetical protein